MSVKRIAVRYAKPLLELAEEKKALDSVFADVSNIQTICKGNRDFELMLKSPIIAHQKKAAILDAIFGAKVHAITKTFLQVITRKERENLLPEIADEFVTIYNQKQGFQEATISTTFKLDADTKKAVESLVTEITGKKPQLTEKIDPALLGGYILKLGDQQIDESISGQLRNLKLKFKKENI